MFFFDIQQRGPWDGNTTIVQTHFQNGMACSILSGGVVAKFANGLHLFGSFEGLCIIDNEKQMFVFFCEQSSQHVQRNLLGYERLVEVTSPEEFAVICAMSTVPQQLDESVYSAAMADADRYHHRPEVAVDMFRNLPFYRFEKTLQFFWDFADCNHTASLQISVCLRNAYRQTKLFLFDNCYHQNPSNRSV
jgi:hypothetical protein